MSEHEADHEFEALLDYLKRSRGVDLTGYKRPSLLRRFDRQMRSTGVASYAEYISYLEASPGEISRLLDSILINVTGFFRDPEAWEVVQKDVVPQILAAKKPDDPLRVWCAGCATGEEAYTIAMILAEAAGMDFFRSKVTIHATDMDEDALTRARQALYSERDAGDVPEPLRERYLERNGGRWAVDKTPRQSVIFGRHDLIQDVPISRLDLLICRNTLMYFNAEVQDKILARFHFALNPRGCLMLGKAEMLVGRHSLYTPVDLRRRIVMRLPNGNNNRNHAFYAAEPPEEAPGQESSLPLSAFQTSPLAQVVVSADGNVALASDRARLIFRLTRRDIGSPFRDLGMSYQPVELRSVIEKVHADRHAMVVKGIVWNPREGETVVFDVHIVPLITTGGLAGVCITFLDITDSKRLQDELEISNRELNEAYEEAQSANEELETMNEELQSSAEELETTNEELQSANEELETMNEEMQSSAEELQTINDELRQRSYELTETTAFLESLMNCLPGGLVVIGPDLTVQAWNHKAEDLWGLRGEEAIGKNLMALDIGLEMERLYPLVRKCLSGSSEMEEVTLDATNRRGRPIRCRVTCMSVASAAGQPRGAMFLMASVA